MPKARQTMIYLAQWGGLQLPAVIVDGEGAFIPVKLLCAALMGTIDDRPYRARIKRDPILRYLWRHLNIDLEGPGGPQDMFCLEHTGLGRWMDRLDIEKVRADIRPRILELMWDITLKARSALYGEVESSTLPAIVPAALPSRRAPVTIQDQDVKRLLLALAARVGEIEISQRELQALLVALATGSADTLPLRCPKCGYAWQGQGEGDGEE